jgi:hypothetical protein
MVRSGRSAPLRNILGACAGTLGSLLFQSNLFAADFATTPVRELSAAVVEKTPEQNRDGSKDSPQRAVVRWNESQPGCTFFRGNDGKYSYGLWTEDLGIVLAVDARELQLIRHRIEPILGLLLSVRYRGNASLDETSDGITLEFVKHFKVVQPALDPDSYGQKIQADAEALDDETRRAIKKHPDQKQIRIQALQEYQKSADQLIEFLNSDSLRPAHLDRVTPEAHGWVFFNTDTKWIGSWKSQEELVLRFPLAGKIFEFPFKLPPEPGELLLRERP